MDSTSRIESVWNELKGMMKRIYNTIRSKKFIYFLREVEFRHLIKNLTNKGKLFEFAKMFSCVGIREKYDYLSEDELLSLEYDTIFDD